MRPAVLRGREHIDIGAVAIVAEGACAVAISRGGASKTYGYKDPNEDAAAFCAGAGGVLLAVADGHSGSAASEIAVQRLVERFAGQWTDTSATGLELLWATQARRALVDINETIVRETTLRGCSSARTTLALAVLRPGDDLLAWAAVGDSHLYSVRADGTDDRALDPDVARWFLGSAGETADSVRQRCVLGAASLGDTRAVVLATDGLSEVGIGVADPAAAVAAAVAAAATEPDEFRPREVARGVVDRALASHRENRAGDNIATAVAYLTP